MSRPPFGDALVGATLAAGVGLMALWASQLPEPARAPSERLVALSTSSSSSTTSSTSPPTSSSSSSSSTTSSSTTSTSSSTTSTTAAPAPTTAATPARTEWQCPEAVQTATAVGWPLRELPILDRVVYRESRCQPAATNLVGRDRSYGLMQINTIGSLWEHRRGLCGLSSPEDLLSPAVNLSCALKLWQLAGWQPWGE